MKRIACVVVAASAAVSGLAQDTNHLTTRVSPVFSGDMEQVSVFEDAFTFEDGRVKGKPFSVEQSTDSIRTLSDGNRIVTARKVRLSRDSEGRVRRETIAREGGEESTSVTISDPVAGVSYSLDPKTKTARKLASWPRLNAKLERLNDRLSTMGRNLPKLDHLNDRLAEMNQQLSRLPAPEVHVTIPDINLSPVQVDLIQPDLLARPVHAKGYSSMHEDLGEEKIEGVVARGERDTTKIPAGAIGNEKPITITSERWFSPELGIEVKALRSDPRYGETRISVSHVSETEPDHALFQVPSDYKLTFQDGPGRAMPAPPTPPVPPAPPRSKH